MRSGEVAGRSTWHRAGRIVLALVVVMAATAPSAVASKTRVPLETLPTPPFENAQAMAVDPETGNLLVVDRVAKTLSRWKPNGEPAPFTALGTNVIDAKEGADATPENGFEFGTPPEVQVVVDNSGAATDGDIYVTQSGKHLVDIFAADGSFLGQLTASFGPNDEQQRFNNPGASVTYNVTIPDYGTTANIVGSVSGGTLCKTYINPVLVSAVGPGTHCIGTGGDPKGPKTVTFIGALANTNIPTMEVKEVPGGTSFPVETLVNGGTGPTPLGQPCGVAVDASGAAYVADFENEAIYRYVSQGAPHNPLVPSDNVVDFDMTKVFGFETALHAGGGRRGHRWCALPQQIRRGAGEARRRRRLQIRGRGR